MGRKAIALAIVATLLVASLAFAIVPFTNNGGKSSPVQYTESSSSSYGVSTTEKTSSDQSSSITPSGTTTIVVTEEEKAQIEQETGKTIEEIEESAYVSQDGQLYAYLTGTQAIPIVTLVGNTHSSEIPTAKVTTYNSYMSWISKTVTDGINLNQEYGFGCTAFHVQTDAGHYVGRNLDWTDYIKHPVVVKCVPQGGYASIGIAAKEMFFSSGATFDTMMGSPKLAGMGLFVTEGMNEKGLTCSGLMVNYDKGYSSKDGGVFAYAMLRYLLDYADNVETAKRIVTEIGINTAFSSDGSMHLFVTDKAGNAITIEVVNGKLCFTETQYISNFFITPGSGVRVDTDSTDRYNAMKNLLDGDTYVTLDECRDALEAAQGGNGYDSLWSIVFDVEELKLYVWYFEKYDVDPAIYDVNQLVAIRDASETEEDITIDDEEDEIPAE